MSRILLTGGAGDFLATHTAMTDDEIAGVEEIYYATRAEKLIRQLTPFIFPNLKKETTVCSDFTPSYEINRDPENERLLKQFCCMDKKDLINRFPILVPNEELEDVKDYSISIIATEVVNKVRGYRRPAELLDQKLADIDVELPEKFYFVHPWSDNQRFPERDFMQNECEAVVKYLETLKTVGIVINNSIDPFPIKSDFIIDQTGKNSFLQCVEVIKKSAGFIGCASVFSVLAPKLYDWKKIFIKSGENMKSYMHLFYYVPIQNNFFIHYDLEFLGTKNG